MVVEEAIANHPLGRLRDMYGCLPAIDQVDIWPEDESSDLICYVYHDANKDDGEFTCLTFERPQVFDANCAGDGEVVARPLAFHADRVEQLMLRAPLKARRTSREGSSFGGRPLR